jgi:hypothetical protein
MKKHSHLVEITGMAEHGICPGHSEIKNAPFDDASAGVFCKIVKT